MDVRLALARQHHRHALNLDYQAQRAREQRNRLIRQVRAEDPVRWSYAVLASATGLSRPMIAVIITSSPRTSKMLR
jgi:hypothetical protein